MVDLGGLSTAVRYRPTLVREFCGARQMAMTRVTPSAAICFDHVGDERLPVAHADVDREIQLESEELSLRER